MEQEQQIDRVLAEKKLLEKTKGQSFWELVRFAIIAILIVIPIRMFIIQPFVVSGLSMIPTFEDRQYLIVDEISYKINDLKRDDVVVFRYPNDTKKFFIKRVIGLPGETIDIKGNDITITNKNHPEGLKLEQPYVKNVSNNDIHFQLADDQYYVMGDNRSASSDSRYWGPVPKKLMIGRVLLRLLPVNKIGLMPGKYTQVE